MKTDYEYCMTAKCVHKEECKRWIGRYTDEQYKKLQASGGASYVDDYECESQENKEKPPYQLLDKTE